jgi:hypothetical protein
MPLNNMFFLFSPGDTARDKENLVPDDNDALHMQLPHMSSQGQGSLVTGMSAPKTSIQNKFSYLIIRM